MHEAEFSDDEGQLIIPPCMLRHAIEHPPAFVDGPQVAFCDFAAGGDQNVCAVRRGNRVTVEAKWKETNTLQACRRFIDIFERLRLKPYQVYCDGSGLGVTMCDALEEEFGQVHRVLNGSSAEDDAYSNRGSEIRFTAKRAIEDGHIILPGDPEFFTEATDRQIHYDKGKYLWAKPKKLMKKRGVHSPAVSDSVLAAIVCGPQNFVTSPKAKARMVRELRQATQTMAAYRSPFATPHINFDRGFF
jgi:hypothetical protein